MMVLSSTAMAQPQIVATGVPAVGTSGGPQCITVYIGTTHLVVPSSANYGPLLLALQGAESRNEIVDAVAAGALWSPEAMVQCGALLNPNSTGDVENGIIAFRQSP